MFAIVCLVESLEGFYMASATMKVLKFLKLLVEPSLEEDSGSLLAFCSLLISSMRYQAENSRYFRTVSSKWPILVIFFGLFLLGIGRTMPYSFGLPITEHDVKEKHKSLYFGSLFFFRILGPVFGFSLSFITNKLYYISSEPSGITPEDPMWIGRWWIGFFTIGGVLLCLSSLMSIPSSLATSNNVVANGDLQDYVNQMSDGENDLNQFTVGERPGDRRAQNSTISNICGEENN
ncbi:unnamed protein product [Enterobius vermicularis]|uniref:Solute carrier organic anion transporter family member n=1 Tax=Enterobius vermicularis TaxID=51028 RepID=A0A0N4V306_ENTVE|nr:unnamed protein product [Enterobius vermicularis]